MFGGSWNTQQAQPQQQQQQQTGGLFGGGAGAGAFGQPQGQQQQQQAGGFGQPAGGGGLFGGAGGGTGGGFGAGGFGAPAATAAPNAFGATQARPTFGATGTSTGGGLFGGSTGTFGSTGGFGTAAAPQANTGGLFGSSTNAFGAKPATTTFGAAAGSGATGGLFGAKPAVATGFGAPAIANALPQPVTNGSLAPPYVPLREKDGTAANAGWGVYNTITCMPEYRGTSLEEIRLQDYAAGRKVAPPAGTTGATGFGAQPAQGGLFGQPAAQPSTGLFGQPAAQTNAFGQPAGGASGTGLFGAAQQNTTNAFGQPQQQAQTNAFGQPAQQSTGLFGQPAQQNTGAGLFGQTQPAQQSGGLFGAAPAQSSTGLFGANNNTAGTQSTGLFGQQNTASTGFGGFGAAQLPQQAKPAFGFGAPAAAAPATNTGFGQPAQNTTTPSFGFGQPQQQAGAAAQPAAGGFGFGATGAQPTGTGLFGASAQPQQQGGLFGTQQNNAPKPGGLFGSNPAQPAAGGGLFGSTGGFGANTQQQQPTTSLFGNPNTANTNTGGGLFGSTQNNQTNTAGQAGASNTGGLFGGGGFGMQNKPAGTNTGTGLFGSTNTTAQQPGTSLFGNTGAAGGFGATGATGGGTSLFGNNQATQQQQPGTQPAGQTGGLFSGGSLFGNNNANKPAGTGMFGSTGPAQQSNTGGGLFGNLGQSQNQQQQQQAPGFGGGSLFGNQSTNNNNSLGNSQAQQPMPQINPNDPYGSGNLFANPPNFAPINTSTTKALPPLTSSFRAMPTPVKQPLRLRGYAASPGVNSPRLGGSTLGNSALGLSTASSGSPMRGSLFDRPSTDVLSPAAFTPRSSVKKLVIDKKITGANLAASLSQSTRAAVDRNLINPDADGDVGNGNVSLFGGNESVPGTPSRSVSAAVKVNTNGKSAPAPKSLNTLSRNVDLADFEQGEYYTIPDMHSLCNAAHEELKTVEDFVVGRKGFGELRYLEPVDVASIGDLKSICGEYVVFQRGTCEVYPEGTIPMEPGNGLNHHARITLEKCFPKDKSTGEPVTDPTAPRVQQHMRKLKAMDGTSFQSYDPQTGTWVFEVDHFTKYGLEDDDDDEDMDDMGQQSNHSGSPSMRGSPSSLPEQSVTTRSPSTQASVTASLSSHNDENDSQSENFQYDDAKLKLSVFEQDFTPKASRFVDQQSHLSYFHEAEEDDVREFDMTHVKPTSFGYQLPSSFQPTWSYQSIPGTSSLATKHEHSKIDLGASHCRSFGVGWSNQGSLVSYGQVATLDSGNQLQPFVINQKSVPGVKVANEKERRRMQEMLDLLIERSDIQVDESVPFIRTQDSLRFQHLTGLFAGDKSHEAQAWRLGAALFDPIEAHPHEMKSDDLMIDMDAFSRKMAFSDWLESSVAPAVERADLNASEGPERVFALLCGHRLEAAVSHALHSGDLRLATLLGSIGNEETKTAMAAQLDAWRKDKVDSHISKEYLRVYALLAGKADLMPEHGQDAIDITEGLDWLRAFALSFWYRTPLEQPIELAVETYQQRLEQVPSLPQPVLKHVSAYRAKQESRPEDALYSLIKIFCRQDRALDVLSDPAKFGKTAGEARVQWHVCDLLLNVLGYGSHEDGERTRDLQAFDRLTVAYAAQLESADLWTSAVFVLLHLSEENARVKAVKDLLLRQVESLSDETSEFLVNLLCVPASWIAEAKAFHYHAQGEIYFEFLTSLEAGLFNRAHAILVDRLASEAILRDDVGLLKKLLTELEDENVENWANGGATLLDYADIVETVPVLLQSRSSGRAVVADAGTGEALARVEALLPSVASRIEGLWKQGITGLSHADVALQNRAAKTQMLEIIHQYAGDLADHQEASSNMLDMQRCQTLILCLLIPPDDPFETVRRTAGSEPTEADARSGPGPFYSSFTSHVE
ncbi:hypothetical protein QFC21_006993 [Naganishia friedmannii]|uniref:Uncharacterized protein n=1 Tax=Naganishia friedmannii TaxID=89922 RepID=A0ACC2UYV6_9TREE|nr:hypothetical protein QFC21_006993 [Naganishia friedmannii]